MIIGFGGVIRGCCPNDAVISEIKCEARLMIFAKYKLGLSSNVCFQLIL